MDISIDQLMWTSHIKMLGKKTQIRGYQNNITTQEKQYLPIFHQFSLQVRKDIYSV